MTQRSFPLAKLQISKQHREDSQASPIEDDLNIRTRQSFYVGFVYKKNEQRHETKKKDLRGTTSQRNKQS